MQATQQESDKSIGSIKASRSLWRTPSVTIARLTLESYFRSGWMWAEFVLVLVFFAAVYSIGLALIAGFWLERRELLLY